MLRYCTFSLLACTLFGQPSRPHFNLPAAGSNSALEVTSVVNAASFAPGIAPGSLISIFGANLQDAAVEIEGRSAPVFFSSITQINAQLPFEIPPGAANLRVGTLTVPIQVTAAAPGIFKLQGDRASTLPVNAGDYATIYLTGQGEVTPVVATGQRAPAEPLSLVKLPVSVTVGGMPAGVQFAGLAPGFTGLMQLNLRVPSVAAGDQPVVVTIGGVASNTALIPVAGVTVSWQPGLRAERTGEFPHGGRTYASSSSLRVNWTPPDSPVDHYILQATESRSSIRQDVAGLAREAVIAHLKAGTEYAVEIRACSDAACAAPLQPTAVARASTEDEYWTIQGQGSSYSTADHLVPDGNVGSYAFRYGPWAGPALDGKVQLYYNPAGSEEKGVKIGEMIASAADSLQAASAFRGVSGFGLLRVCQPIPGAPGTQPTTPAACSGSPSVATNLNLSQAVPLSPSAGSKVRLFFEAGGGDGRTRILYLDSQDGYLGRDFHSGAATRCNTLADYSPGGGCEPKVAIGVDIDKVEGNPNVINARQFKILYPTQESWAWDLQAGTPMWFTTEWTDGRCSRYPFNAAYAIWNGSKWNVAYGADGCPKLLPGVQAPAPVHLGGARYKLYFNLHPATTGTTDPQQALKPMRLLYADPEASGDPARVEYEDWEPLTSARQLHYLWAAGGLLTEQEESRLDDYAVFAPTADPARLIMYANMSTGGQGFPFIGSAVLLNP